MLEKYDLTKIEVQGSVAFKVVEYINQRSGDPQNIILAKTVTGFSDVCQELKRKLRIPFVLRPSRFDTLPLYLLWAWLSSVTLSLPI